MFKGLIRYIMLKMGKKRPVRRKPLYDAHDPRRIVRQRNNRIYRKALKQHQQAENHID
ncbi:MAG: hypothetical protein JKX85_03360 [Phycisphaeraceae bacterium]|nr:hypothetical protein [Phycisphaeraceae bacterium]